MMEVEASIPDHIIMLTTVAGGFLAYGEVRVGEERCWEERVKGRHCGWITYY